MAMGQPSHRKSTSSRNTSRISRLKIPRRRIPCARVKADQTFPSTSM
ncbi:UNVERIFIED_CONTAM: hypothetical protein GTU68_013809 [Idotea baltica]|nr:hypothetical protein [Idotea baltica]